MGIYIKYAEQRLFNPLLIESVAARRGPRLQ